MTTLACSQMARYFLLSCCLAATLGHLAAAAGTVEYTQHVLLSPAASYPGDGTMCANNTLHRAINTYNLDQCYTTESSGHDVSFMYSMYNGDVVYMGWDPAPCGNTPPKSQWRKIPLGVAGCSVNKGFTPGKGLGPLDWCTDGQIADASSCVGAAMNSPLGKSLCPNAKLNGPTAKQICGGCTCYFAETYALV